MGLESGTYISDLVSSNPAGSDNESQGDDHLRLIKAAAQATFPNADRAYYFENSTAKTANYTVLTTDHNKIIAVNAISGNISITLPGSLTTHFSVRILRIDSALSNVITIYPTGSTIDDVVSQALTLQWQAFDLHYCVASSQWFSFPSIGRFTPYYAGGQNIPFSDIAPSANAKKILGAATATDFSEQDIATVLEWLGTAARGDIILRGASAFAFKNLGAAGTFAKSDGTDLVYGLPLVPARDYQEYTTNAALSTVIPYDDTIPQIGEGTQILSGSITPIKSTSRIRARFQGFGALASGNRVGAALFKDGAASAVRATWTRPSIVDQELPLALEYEFAPGALTAIAFTVRVGANSGDMRMNGTSAARIGGGSAAATLILEEWFTA